MTASKEPDENTPKPKRAANGTYLPGVCPNPSGRPKGSRNAVTMTIKDSIEEAFLQAGGVQWLLKLAQEEPRAFATLLSKLLPPTPPDDAGEMVIRVIGGFTSEPDDD
jgi:hypothetical protein